MNKRYEMAIANLRGLNKSVKSIAKKLGIKKDDIEEFISNDIMKSNPIIDELTVGKRATCDPNAAEMVGLIKKLDDSELFKNDEIISYMCMHKNNYHDRFMDYLRYKILNLKN